MRTSHSTRAGCCLMRFDHFCPWIGQDVGMFNHWLFYRMAVAIGCYLVVAFLVSATVLGTGIYQLVACQNDKEFGFYIGTNKLCVLGDTMQVNATLYVVCVVIGAIFIALSGYFIYSIIQLYNFHYNLLKSGTLTREYLGSFKQNFSITGCFSLFDVKENIRDIHHNYLEQLRPAQNAMEWTSFLENLVESSPEITNFDTLLAKLKELKYVNPDIRFLLEFQYFILKYEESHAFSYTPVFLRNGDTDKIAFFQNLVSHYSAKTT